MTHPIPAGTCNVPVNLTTEARAILGRLACAEDVSLGELIRRALVKALSIEHPTEAQALARAERRRHAMGAVLLLVGLLSIAESWLGGTSDMRRPSRGARIVRAGKGAA